MANIHPTAIVASEANLAEDVYVGPFCIIEGDVEIGAGTRIESHAIIHDGTRMGSNNRVFPYAILGGYPHDLKYKGEKTYLKVGDGNSFHEGCTIHRGTVQDNGETLVGNNNLIMLHAHVAHDCHIYNNTILGYKTAMGGHVHVCDWATASAGVMAVQRHRIGTHAYVAPNSVVRAHVPAFVLVDGAPRTINEIGLKRRDFSDERIALIKSAYKILYLRGLSIEDAISELEALGDSEDIKTFIASIQLDDGGQIMRPRIDKQR